MTWGDVQVGIDSSKLYWELDELQDTLTALLLCQVVDAAGQIQRPKLLAVLGLLGRLGLSSPVLTNLNVKELCQNPDKCP